MSQFEADTSAVARLASTLDEAGAALLDLTLTNDAAADDVLGFVTPPIRTGRLDDSVRAEHDALGFVILAGGPGAPYAPYVNARTQFLAEAHDRANQGLVDQYVDHAQDAVDLIQGD